MFQESQLRMNITVALDCTLRALLALTPLLLLSKGARMCRQLICRACTHASVRTGVCGENTNHSLQKGECVKGALLKTYFFRSNLFVVRAPLPPVEKSK